MVLIEWNVPLTTSCRCFSLAVILSIISWSIFLVQSGGSGSASMSLSHGVRREPGPTPAPKEDEAEVPPERGIETPEDPSDRADPETRLPPDWTSDGLGLSKLNENQSINNQRFQSNQLIETSTWWKGSSWMNCRNCCTINSDLRDPYH